MGSEHFAFVIEPGRDGFPGLTDDPSVWSKSLDDVIGERFTGRKDPEKLARKAEKLEEWIEAKLDLEDDDYEEKLEQLLTREQAEIRGRGEDLECYGGVRSVMGIMPYAGDWIPLAQYLYAEPWDFDLEPGIPQGKTWSSALACCWQMAGVMEPAKLPSPMEGLADALEVAPRIWQPPSETDSAFNLNNLRVMRARRLLWKWSRRRCRKWRFGNRRRKSAASSRSH